jgi:exodeoxyribonuclease VIII
MPYRDYEAEPGLRASQLAMIRESPAVYRHRMDNPGPPTAAMDLGTATHTAVLQPEKLVESCRILDRRSAKQVEACREEGTVPLRGNEYELVLAMRDAVREHPHAAAILGQASYQELSMFWARPLECRPPRKILGGEERPKPEEDAPRTVDCKARLDIVSLPLAMVVDLKTARSVDPLAFSTSCWRYGYHMAAWWYLQAAQLHGWNVKHFAWIVVEKTAPYAVAVYIASEKMLHAGRIECYAAIETLMRCEDTGDWKAKVGEIAELDLPGSAYEKLGIA